MSGKKNNIALAFIIIITVALPVLSIKATPGIQATQSGKPYVLTENDIPFSVIKDGDIICRLGDRFWSNIIKDVSITDKRFSHIGIIRINDGKITVINAEGDTDHGRDFVNEISMNEFLKHAVSAGIYRINNIDGKFISELAAEYLGVPFDWQFNMNDPSKLYCTELLYVICKRMGLELDSIYVKELKNNAIPLESISGSKNFSEIYYVFR